MLLPLPQPGEISVGYVGRIRTLNRFKDHKTTVLELRNHLHRQKVLAKVRTIRIEACTLAVTAGLSVPQYVRDHTMIPFWDGLSTKSVAESRHGEEYNLTRCPGNRLVSARSGAAYCPACIMEQRDSLGFTYWRREWQIPGVETCFRDGEPLVVVPNPTGFGSPPGVFPTRTHESHRFAIESEGIAFYRSASTLILLREYPIATQLLDVARQQYKQWLRQHRSEGLIGPWVDTSSPLYIPTDWIRRHRQDFGFFSSYAMVSQDRFLNEISTSWKILLLSFLFKSFKEFRLLTDAMHPNTESQVR